MLAFDLLPQGVDLRKTLNRFKVPLPIGSTPSCVIFEESSLRVLKYDQPARDRHALPIIMIPSMINRHYILDLLPGKSFVEYLLSRKYQVYMLEWKVPEDEDRWVNLAHLIEGRVQRAIEASLRSDRQSRGHVFGHCLGGTLAMIYSLLHQERVASLSLLTTPIDFEAAGQLSIWSRFPGLDLDAMIEAYGNAPWALMHSAFNLMRPAAGVGKYIRMLGKLTDKNFMKNFAALEVWAADNVSFPGSCYQSVIHAFYRKNELCGGKLELEGRPVSLEETSFPVLSIAAHGDHIVPVESTLQAAHLGKAAGELTSWTVGGGHIGALLGRKAQNELWPRLADWILEKETPPS